MSCTRCQPLSAALAAKYPGRPPAVDVCGVSGVGSIERLPSSSLALPLARPARTPFTYSCRGLATPTSIGGSSASHTRWSVRDRRQPVTGTPPVSLARPDGPLLLRIVRPE